MNLLKKYFRFIIGCQEKVANRHIFKSSVLFQFCLILRIILAAMTVKFAFHIGPETFNLSSESFFWVKVLALYLIPYVIGFLHFYMNPADGLTTIRIVSGLFLAGSIFLILNIGLMIGFFGAFIMAVPLDIYLYIKSTALREKFCRRKANNILVFACIVVISALVVFVGPYIALRVHFSDVEYIDVKGEVKHISGIISPNEMHILRGDVLYDFTKFQENREEPKGHFIFTNLGGPRNYNFSADSKYIAFAGKPKQNKDLPGITIVAVEKAMMNDRTEVELGVAPAELKLTFSRELLGDNVVLGMVFSPDGKYFACETEKAVVLWEFGTGNVYKLLNRDFLHIDDHCGKPKTKVVFSADSKKLLTSASESGRYTDGRVFIWDVNTKKLLNNIDIGKGNIQQIKFSPDGSKLVYLFNGYPYNKMPQYSQVPEEAHRIVAVWDIEANQMERFIYDKDGGHGYIEMMDYSPDGKYIATVVGAQCLVSIWDAATGKKIKVIKSHLNGAAPDEITYSPDGKYLEADSGGVIKERWQRDQFGI